MAELYGKGTGLVKGKGGSMHLFDVENGFMGGYGIVGGHIPLGVGMAYALRYQDTESIVQLYLGDGAIHNGAFHEAANLAGLWGKDGLNPRLFILENNQYGMGTSVERATATTDLGRKFDSYGIEHEKVDGMDLEAVLALRAAGDRAGARNRQALRASKRSPTASRPTARPTSWRNTAPRKRSRKRRERDPIGIARASTARSRRRHEDELDAIRAEAKAIVDEAVRFAEESPEPSLDELYTDVYA